MNTKTEALVSTSPDTAISVSGSAKKTPVEPAGTTFTFKEPLGSASAIYWLVLAILAGYGLTFGLQDLAKVFHSPFLQKIADFFFYGGMMTKAVWQGQIWRPVTVAFLHGGMFHLFGNVANLLFLAWFCRVAFARKGWLAIFFTSSILGAMVTTLVQPDANTVGASIGIMGLFGALMAAEWRKRKIDRRLLPAQNLIPLKTLCFLMVFQLVVEHLIPNVSHTGHIAGVTIGLIMGLILPLNAGVRLLASRPDLVQLTGCERVTRRQGNKAGLRVVKSLTYSVNTPGDADYLALVQTEHGHARLVKTTVESVVGQAPPAESLLSSNPYLVADRFSVPFLDAIPVEKETVVEVPPTPVPLWKRGLLLVGLGYCWHYLFVSWAPDMTMPKASLAWMHFLPDVVAGPAISLVSVLGALIVTYCAASMIINLVGSNIISFFEGLFGSSKSPASDKEKSQKSD